MRQKRIEFSAESLLQLCTHYLQDHENSIPLDVELRAVGVSPYVDRWVMLEVESKEWDGAGVPINPVTGEPEFLHVRYEGHKTASWQQDRETPMEWKESVGSPNE